LRQGDLSVTDYYNELSKIWQQIDFVMPCVTKCSERAGVISRRENQIRAYKFLDGLNSEFDQIRQQLTQKEPSVTPIEAFMVVVHEESRQKLMTPTTVKEGAIAAVATPRNTQLTPIERMCNYCHKKDHIRDTYWDLHGRPSGGRGWTGRGGGRRGSNRSRLGRTQQAYASEKVHDDGASASEPTVEDMVARLTSQMTALHA
jgi:hypothetical protein